MPNTHHRLEHNNFKALQTTESAESDRGYSGIRDYRSWATQGLKQLLTYSLALLLLVLALFFVLFGQDSSRPYGNLMSREWPRVFLAKTYIQRLLRDLRRTSQSKHYVR